MSVWEVEDAVEQLIDVWAKSDASLRDKRNAYGGLYATQEQHDCSFTHFRAIFALNEANFFVRINPEDHPDYSEMKARIDKVREDGGWVSNEDRSVNCYYQHVKNQWFDPGIWFDPGMSLWARARETGLIEGLAAEPLADWSTAETLSRTLALIAPDLTDLPAQPSKQGFFARLSGKAPAPQPATEAQQTARLIHGLMAYSILTMGDPSADDQLHMNTMLATPGLSAAVKAKHEDWIEERFDGRKLAEWGDSDAFRSWNAPYTS